MLRPSPQTITAFLAPLLLASIAGAQSVTLTVQKAVGSSSRFYASGSGVTATYGVSRLDSWEGSIIRNSYNEEENGGADIRWKVRYASVTRPGLVTADLVPKTKYSVRAYTMWKFGGSGYTRTWNLESRLAGLVVSPASFSMPASPSAIVAGASNTNPTNGESAGFQTPDFPQLTNMQRINVDIYSSEWVEVETGVWEVERSFPISLVAACKLTTSGIDGQVYCEGQTQIKLELYPIR